MKTTIAIILMIILSFVLLSGKKSEKDPDQTLVIKEEIRNKGKTLILYSANDHIFKKSSDAKKNRFLKFQYAHCAESLISFHKRASASKGRTRNDSII